MSNDIKIPTRYEVELVIIKNFLRYTEHQGFHYSQQKDWRKGTTLRNIKIKTTEELLKEYIDVVGDDK